MVLYVGWRLVKRCRSPSLVRIDLDSGRYKDGIEELQDQDKLVRRNEGKLRWFWKVYGVIA